MWLGNAFDSFIPVIISKKRKFKSSVLFEIHILLARSSRVLQLPVHLFRLTANG